jgi:hypothetical protein
MTVIRPIYLSWCLAPFWGSLTHFYYCQTVAGLLMWCALSDKSTGLSFTVAASPFQCSHSGSPGIMTLFYCLWFETSEPVRQGPHIYDHLEQSYPVILPGTGSSFHHLLWLTDLQWKFLNQLPCKGHWLTGPKSKSKLCYDWRSVG